MTTTIVKPATTKAPIKQLIMDTLQTLDLFCALLSRETEALRKSDFKTVDHLQTDKRNFARDYQVLVTTLNERKEDMSALDLPTREKLVKTRTRFTHILTENTRALELMKESTQRLVDRILETARMAVTDETQTSYSVKGNVQSYKTSTLALSIDHNI